MSGPLSHSWRSIKNGEEDADSVGAGVVIGVEEGAAEETEVACVTDVVAALGIAGVLEAELVAVRYTTVPFG